MQPAYFTAEKHSGADKIQKSLRSADSCFSIEEEKASHQADLGSFGAQQIRWDYVSLIPCKVDSRIIDSSTS